MAALAVLPLALMLAGCGGTEDVTQQLAREATRSHVAGDAAYERDDVHCTGNPRPWFVERQATVSICAVRRVEGGCDWFRVELVALPAGPAARVEPDTENAGCVLPA